MFNWLFGKKKEATASVVLEIEVLDNPTMEVVDENPNMVKLFEAFPELKELCNVQLDMDKTMHEKYSSLYDETKQHLPKITETQCYKKLSVLPAINKVFANGSYFNYGVFYSYLSVDNRYINIRKVDSADGVTHVWTNVYIINPPVLRVVENLFNNADSWDMLVNITNISEGTSEIVGYTEECIKNLKKGLSGYPMEIQGYIELRKYLIKGDIRISLSEKTLKVKSDEIKLSSGEIELLKEISLDYEHKLIQNAKIEFEKEETQKRAAMDEVVAELFKGE